MDQLTIQMLVCSLIHPTEAPNQLKVALSIREDSLTQVRLLSDSILFQLFHFLVSKVLPKKIISTNTSYVWDSESGMTHTV